MKDIFLVRYKSDDFIEGFVEKESDFLKWLKCHNKKRKIEGESEEELNEFELIQIQRCEVDVE